MNVPTNHRIHRRRILRWTVAGAGASLLPNWAMADGGTGKPLRFGVIADVHQDIMHDAEERLQAFIQHMNDEKPDFIVQLGDFCVPIERNRRFMEIWNQFSGPRYHVLGNHDMDGFVERKGAYAFSTQETVAYWEMPSRHYGLDAGGVRFVVLDANDPSPDQEGPRKGYSSYVAQDQVEWLERELDATRLPVVLFSHQSLERDRGGVSNQTEVRSVLEQANEKAGFQKVIACFSGHHHRDYVREINGIHYPQINSASYFWMGPAYRHARYSDEIHRRHPNLQYVAPYRDPLWAMVTIDREAGVLTIDGRSSDFVAPSPWDLGADREAFDSATLNPAISDRKRILPARRE